MSKSNANEPPEKHTPQLSLSSLPDDIVLRCLVGVPRIYHLNVSWVSKHLRTLVRSPELTVLRSTLPNSCLNVCLEENLDFDHSFFHWFTLNKTEYGFVLNPTPIPSHPSYGSSTVAVLGSSKIFFIGGPRGEPSTDLWILDTRSGTITQGPSMTVPRVARRAAVGVIDGKIHVMGGRGFNEEIQVEVFDPNSETWELAGVEKVRKISRSSVSVERKVYMVEYEETNVYNPRKGEGEPRMVRFVSEMISEGTGRKKKFTEMAHSVCVVEDVLFGFFTGKGLMWFDTKLNVWRRLLVRDGKQLVISRVKGMSEYDGRLVVFNYIIPTHGLWGVNEDDIMAATKNVQCILVSLDRAGDKICGTIVWSGVVATVPLWFNVQHCLAVPSDY
ncbi:unnamed protein product [Eruca vesicaria subsp. sativa]|uniref:F-box domain-containing protein n=1 Tax=Eruca vesicaria subsp. sativa TaxID=29727 RepID=A0ABC8KRP0_ERUVS|nr:unnamed protein product [Eruca vesicaria subsp. sativa]